jgi:mannitol/fructose-specific phosphotransferase system IIA component (Ntr-type)
MGEAKKLSEETRATISQMVYALFVPIFFASIGLKIDLAADFDLFLVVFMCFIGIAARYLGAWVGVNLTNTPRLNRHLISIAHTPGGMMEIVVALLARESGLITSRVFVAIVFSAVFSSIVMGPWMRSAIKRRGAIRVIDFLAENLVIPALASRTRAEAVRELATRACVQAPSLPLDGIVESALAREQELGTAVGDGVAIPHVRVDGAKKPVLAVGRAPQGIDWDAPDGQPVRYVFFLVSPAGIHDMHVQALAEICRVMQVPRNRERMEGAKDAQDLWDCLRAMFHSSRSRQDDEATPAQPSDPPLRQNAGRSGEDER